jgi:hypothetical protein
MVAVVQAGVMEEMVNDAVDSALDNEDMEEEIDEAADMFIRRFRQQLSKSF